MGTVKEEQSVDLVSVLLCEVLHYESANVVPDETRAINVQSIQEFIRSLAWPETAGTFAGLSLSPKPRRSGTTTSKLSASAGIFFRHVYQNSGQPCS